MVEHLRLSIISGNTKNSNSDVRTMAYARFYVHSNVLAHDMAACGRNGALAHGVEACGQACGQACNCAQVHDMACVHNGVLARGVEACAHNDALAHGMEACGRNGDLAHNVEACARAYSVLAHDAVACDKVAACSHTDLHHVSLAAPIRLGATWLQPMHTAQTISPETKEKY